MRKPELLGLGALALIVLGAHTAMRPQQAASEPPAPVASKHLQLASVAPEARKDVDYAQIDRRLTRLMERPAMVGLAVGIVENGRITFLKGYGETLEGSGEPVTPRTVFRWASVSKGVASTMVGKLTERGKVSFDSPLYRYVKSLRLPDHAEYRATVGDLLSHRLGLYRNAYDNKLEEGQKTKFLRHALAELNLICPPGTCWSYQNIAYDGSSEMVEQITGKSYERALKDNLFNPLGMTSASVSREGLMSAPSWARPHSAGRRELEVTDDYYRVPAAGGVNSNVKDLALWMIAQMGGMPDVVSPRLLETIHAPLVKTPSERRRLRKFRERLDDPYYGYGWRSYDYAGHRIIGHRGGLSGYRSLILFDPQKKSGVVAMWNSNTNQPGGLEFEVMDMLYGLPFRDWLEVDRDGKAPNPEPADDDEQSAAAIAASATRSNAGRG